MAAGDGCIAEHWAGAIVAGLLAMTASPASQAQSGSPSDMVSDDAAFPITARDWQRIDTSIAIGPGPWQGDARIALTAIVPAVLASGRPTLFMMPGGGASRRYFDFRGIGLSGYSQAEYLAARGIIVVLFDPLGAGESSLPADDQLLATPGNVPNTRIATDGPFTIDTMAVGIDLAVKATVAALREGRLAPELPKVEPGVLIGAGHSVGGHLVVRTQANHQSFSAIAPLGASFTQTRLELRPGANYPPRDASPAAIIASGASADLDATGFFGDEDPAVRAGYKGWRSPHTPLAAVSLMQPGVSASAAGAVRVPVLMGYGQRDVTLDPLADVAMFRAATDIHLIITPGMAHNHNFARTRVQQWRHLGQFVQRIARDTSSPAQQPGPSWP